MNEVVRNGIRIPPKPDRDYRYGCRKEQQRSLPQRKRDKQSVPRSMLQDPRTLRRHLAGPTERRNAKWGDHRLKTDWAGGTPAPCWQTLFLGWRLAFPFRFCTTQLCELPQRLVI